MAQYAIQTSHFEPFKIRILLQNLYHTAQRQLNFTFNIQFIVQLTNKSSSSRFSLDGAIYRNRNSLKLFKPVFLKCILSVRRNYAIVIKISICRI